MVASNHHSPWEGEGDSEGLKFKCCNHYRLIHEVVQLKNIYLRNKKDKETDKRKKGFTDVHWFAPLIVGV